MGSGGIFWLKIEAQEKEAEEWGGRAQPSFLSVRNLHGSQGASPVLALARLYK